MDEGLLKKLRAAFKQEAMDIIKSMRVDLHCASSLDEKSIQDWLERTFRSMHSLKGASRAVDNRHVENICMSAESFFASLRKKERIPTEKEIDTLHQCIDCIEELTDEHSSIQPEAIDLISERLTNLAQQQATEENPNSLSKNKKNEIPQEKPILSTSPPPDPKQEIAKASKKTEKKDQASSESIRVSEQRLTKLMEGIEELIRIKLSTKYQSERLENMAENMIKVKQLWNGFHPILNRLEELSAKLEDTHATQLRKQVHKLWDQYEDLQVRLEPLETVVDEARHEGIHQSLGTNRIVDSLEDQLHELLLMPVSESFLVLHNVVRELSREQGKKIDLKIIGDNIEADRRVLETIKDAFIHLIRNAVDHGIESPEDRLLKNKKEKGSIEIRIEQTTAGKVMIWLKDDGAGISIGKIKQRLIQSNLASEESVQSMDKESLLDSIFISGLSTSKTINEISGRGLGMSIVREKIESIGGTISITSKPDFGSEFLIELPVHQATFRGVLFTLSAEQFVFPTPQIEAMIRVDLQEIKTVKNKPSFIHKGKAMPLISLASVLGIKEKPRSDDQTYAKVLVIQSGSRRLAVVIDDVISEQEVLVKNLGPQLKSVLHISGAAITGMGEPALILNANEIIQTASQGGVQPIVVEKKSIQTPKKKRRVMIAEDSFTSRLLLQNVLEAEDYEVESAVDGAAAFATLKTNNFDALISDVDMPRMNGFVLTERVRNDRNIGNTPIILITSLASNEDRERGIDAGANAYIVKSNFDHSELISILDRLIGEKGA